MTALSFLLDKNVFIGTNQEELCKFVGSNIVILPETLFYECYTSSELSDKKFLKRLYQLLKAGAYVTYQLMQIIRDEGKNLSLCSCIIDYSETDNLRTRGFREEKTVGKAEIDEKRKDRSKMAISIKKLASTISQKLEFDNPDCLREIRRLQMNRKERFRKWIEIADQNDIHDLAAKSFRKYVADPKKFCLSTEWLSWHNMRLLYAKALEYCYLKITCSRPKNEYEEAERDLMDIEYLAYLSKCNSFLTNDARLRGLAEVVFPNRTIYSSIREISS